VINIVIVSENSNKKDIRITETILEKACTQVEGFAAAYQKLNEKVVLAGQSKSTLNNYGRQLAHLCPMNGHGRLLPNSRKIKLFTAKPFKN
jgi:hypothetical protein